MYRLFLSFRFLLHHWLMTLIGSFFVGASLVVLVVVMAVMDGFQSKLRETVAGSSADLILTPQYPCDLGALEKELGELVPQVVAAGPLHQTLTVARRVGKLSPLDAKQHFAAVFGIDGRKEQRVNRFGEYLRGERDWPPRWRVRDLDDPFRVHDELARKSGVVGVILGAGLRRDMEVDAGQYVRIASFTSREGDKTEVRWQNVLVVGVYASGNSEFDKVCLFMDHRDFRGFFSEDVERASVRARLENPDQFGPVLRFLQGDEVLDRLIDRSTLPGVDVPRYQRALRVETWQDENRALVRAIESEKSMILVIAFLIVVAGTSSIFAAQWLLVTDKVREIGILRALGARFGGVTSIFVTNGFLMGLLGSAGGALVGLLVVDQIDRVHVFVSWVLGRPVFDPSIYLFDRIPTLVDYREVLRYAAAALVCTLVAAAIPAIRAGLIRPAEALHGE